MTEQESKILAEKARAGDKKAFEKLVSIHKDKLFAFSMTITGGNYAVASDILQEALIKSYLYLASYKGDASFFTWLWKIVRNEFINHLNSVRDRNCVSYDSMIPCADESQSNTVDDISENDRRDILRHLISTMDFDYQEVITVIDLQEMTYEEASAVLDISVSALKSRLFRAREKLSELVVKNKKLFL